MLEIQYLDRPLLDNHVQEYQVSRIVDIFREQKPQRLFRLKINITYIERTIVLASSFSYANIVLSSFPECQMMNGIQVVKTFDPILMNG